MVALSDRALPVRAIPQTDAASVWLLFAALLFLLPGVSQAGGIYRWADADGSVHYGDRPVPGAQTIRTPEPRLGEPVTVKKVLDGDTFLINGDSIRLIGVNAPEVAKRGKPGEPGGLQAQRFLQGLLAGKRTRLLSEEAHRDKYGRKLAHAFLEDGTNISTLLLREGHAYVIVVPPNIGRAAEYFRAETEARQARRGIWALNRYAVQPAHNAEECRNTFCRLRGTVQHVQQGRRSVRLLFKEGLEANVSAKHMEYFAAEDLAPARLAGHTVIVRGWVQRKHGRPVVHLAHPLQIEAVE